MSTPNNKNHTEGLTLCVNNIRLSPHFMLGEFLNVGKYPDNKPSLQDVVNLAYGCRLLLEPAREAIGCPIIVNSGFRNPRVNALVGGVAGSQHLQGQAADIRPKDPQQFLRLVAFLRNCEHTDQLLTGPGWLHLSWAPVRPPRHDVRLRYYK